MQAYSNPQRESEPHALPDVEVFYISEREIEHSNCQEYIEFTVGWYWQACFPGCLPDGDPMGPFDTKAEALADAQQDFE